MFSVFWGSRLIGAYPPEVETLWRSLCLSQGVTYHKNEEGNYFIFPPLEDAIVALYPIIDESNQKTKVVTRLADSLIQQGAIVVYTDPSSSYNKLLRTLKVQIFISFSSKKPVNQQAKVRFFYSLRHKNESLNIISAVIKEMAQQIIDINYEIPSLWEYIRNYEYLRFYLADAPTILLEISHGELTLGEKITSALLQGLILLYGRKPDQEKTALIEKVLDLLEIERELNFLTANQIEESVDSEPEPFLIPEAPQEAFENPVEGEEVEQVPPGTESFRPEGEPIPERVESELTLQVIQPEPVLPKRSNKNKKSVFVEVKRKKQYRCSRYSTMFPPNDGPVFQFSAPGAEEILQVRFDGKYSCEGVPWRREELYQDIRESVGTARDSIPQGAAITPVDHKTYNALYELKSLAQTVKSKQAE